MFPFCEENIMGPLQGPFFLQFHFSLWKQYCVQGKSNIILKFSFPSVVENVLCLLKFLFSYPKLPLAYIRLHFLNLSPGSQQPLSLKLTFITEPVSQPTHFSPDARDSMFIKNVGVHSQENAVPQPIRL